MNKFFPLLLCLLLSIFTVARATKPTPTPATTGAQKNPTGQQTDAKTLLDDENTDQEVATDDEDSMAGDSENDGENVSDDDGGRGAGTINRRGRMTQGMMMEAMTAVTKANKTNANLGPSRRNVSPSCCQHTLITVFLIASRLRRVRLVVRTQPSQGWYTGSTPVRAARAFSRVKHGN